MKSDAKLTRADFEFESDRARRNRVRVNCQYVARNIGRISAARGRVECDVVRIEGVGSKRVVEVRDTSEGPEIVVIDDSGANVHIIDRDGNLRSSTS